MSKPAISQHNSPLRLFLPLLLAALALTGLVWGLPGVSPAQAGAAIRYVDGASGSDASDCTNPASPCQTIQYAINQSPAGDEIRVAQGTYTETIGMGVTLTLKGGYEASGWTRDISANPTIIDANGANSSVVNIAPGANVMVEGFTIQGGTLVDSGYGGGFSVNAATVVISGTTIQNNSATGDSGGEFFGGGALWMEGDGADVSLINSFVLDNTGGDAGGGAVSACCTGGTGNLALQNTLVQGNSTSGEGGAFRLSEVSLFITASQIISNTASGCCGGGIRAEAIPVTITNSSILSNTTNGGGGGLFADNSSSLALNNVNVSGNQAAFSGGGLALSGNATANITDGQIANNTASTGGGLWQDSASATLNSVIVQGNQATSSGYASGGGVDTNNNSSLTLNDSVLADNVVQSTGGGETLGGAINNNFGSVEMNNTIIRNNDSQGTPVVQIYQAALTVTNVLVADNQGPGIAGSPTQGSFTNVTIANNIGFGLGIGPLGSGDPPVNVTVVNSILWGNGTDYYCDTSVGTVNCALSYSDVGVGDTTGTGNISADPLFVDAGNGDYHLQVGSPARDAGTSAGAPPADLEGTPRQGAPDMGAFEWTGFRLYLPVVIQ